MTYFEIISGHNVMISVTRHQKMEGKGSVHRLQLELKVDGNTLEVDMEVSKTPKTEKIVNRAELVEFIQNNGVLQAIVEDALYNFAVHDLENY